MPSLPRRIASFTSLLALALLGLPSARALSWEERVRAQEAIERVHHGHRIWPAENAGPRPPFEAAVPRAVVEDRVRQYLLESAALEAYWGRPLTAEQLQAEMARMVRDTKDRQRLSELFAALGDDALLVAECLARPALADRLARAWFAGDARFGGRAVAAGAEGTGGPTFDAWLAGLARRLDVRSVRPVARRDVALPRAPVTGGQLPDTWANESQIPASRGYHAAVWTGAEMVMWGGITSPASGSGGRYDPATDTWRPTSFANSPAARSGHSMVWTGTHAIVFGGFGCTNPPGCSINDYLDSGARYDPAADVWLPTSPAGAPSSRRDHVAVWTGTDMIVWGGQYSGASWRGDGAHYDPAMDAWSAVAAAGAPSPRTRHQGVWTGTSMIVWGGYGCNNPPLCSTNGYLNTGGVYTPGSGWSVTSTSGPPSGRDDFSAVWTGTEMIVWGGWNGSYLNTGSRYDPAGAGTWTATPTSGAPAARHRHAAAWTGSQMIVWGGTGGVTYGNGARYTPGGSWSSMSGTNAPSARYHFPVVWTGTEMIVWGGWPSVDTGARYAPASDSWVPMALPSAPAPLDRVKAVWTGSEMVAWPSGTVNEGKRYDPATDTFTALPTAGAPPSRADFSMVWTGSEMVVWGGAGYLATGARYNPSTNAWLGVAAAGAPTGRRAHTAVWTGAEMVVWGGETSSGVYSSGGGSYVPGAASWSGLAAAGTPPTARAFHGAVWTGTEMLVWGGFDGDPSGTGGRYTPGTGWSAMSDVDAPFARYDHATVWTGTEMIVFGGYASGSFFNTGGRYRPSTDTWSDVDLAGAPSQRRDATAVWTGTEMILWGGFDGSTQVQDGGRYDPAAPSDPWTPTPSSGAPEARELAAAVWAGDQMILWGGTPNPDLAILYPNTPPRSLPVLVTSAGGDATFTLGTGETLTLDGTASTDGSNPTTPTAYHDRFDALASHEWDVDDDANCGATGYDRTGATSVLTQADLEALGVATPGAHEIWCRVTDAAGARACAPAILTVVDGQAPSAAISVPNGGESWAYSPSPAARRHHLVVWSAFDPFGIARLRLSYTTDGVTFTCIADTGGSCPAAGLTPSSTFFDWAMPTQAEAAAASQTFPSASARVRLEAWDAAGNLAVDLSDSAFYVVQPTTTGIATVMLWHPGRIDAAFPGQSAALGAKLGELAAHNRVRGVLLDLSLVPAVQAAYADWDLDPADQAKANAVASAVKVYLDAQIVGTYTNATYLQLVGDDFQIPFHRLADGTSIYPESSYPAEVGLLASTTVGAAVAAGKVLTDGFYAEMAPEPTRLPAPSDLRFLDDLFCGRLVETPSQMTGVIDTFLAQDGQVDVTSAADEILVTGFDFLYDAAVAVKDGYVAAGKTTDCLLDDPGASGSTPCIDDPYGAADLQAELLGATPHRIANVNTHANHFSYATPLGPLSTAAMDADTDALTGTVIYSSGCHSGLPVPSADPNALDLPELMARKRAVAYVGNTGYGWGLRQGRGLTERLMEGLTGRIVGADSISVGEALSRAKREYVLSERRYDVFDHKVLHQLVLYGIPSYLVVTHVAASPHAPPDALPSPADPVDRACVDGICVEKALRRGGKAGPGASPAVPPGVTELSLHFAFGAGTHTPVATADGTYYRLNGLSSGETGDAIQPHFLYKSNLAGTEAHGVVFEGGAYTKVGGVNPVVAVPRSTNADGGEGSLPAVKFMVPNMSVTNGGVLSAQAGDTNMVVHTGVYEQATSTQHLFDDMQFVVYYSSSGDRAAPVIADPGASGFHTLAGLTADLEATVADASGVYRVTVVYNESGSDRWRTAPLVFHPPSGTWRGSLSLKASTTYFLQAVDMAGNVGMLDATGPDLDGGAVAYGSNWSGPRSWDIAVADGDGDGMPDAYEDQHGCLDKLTADGGSDPDLDYLSSLLEFQEDLDPCDADMDGGGDNDGSERNNGRDPRAAADDVKLTIDVVKNGSDYTISWPDVLGQNAAADGHYFVYRSDTPFFDPSDLIAGPLANGTTSHVDMAAPCTLCFYNVWNVALATPAPVVAAVVPPTGPPSGGTSVDVYGSHFVNGATVTFGGVPASNVAFSSANKISCTTPAHAAGAVNVRVVNPNGQDGVLPGGFTYQ